MKKTFALLLCIVLCFYFIPLPLSATGTIQYTAITAEDPEDENTFRLDPATSVSEAVYNSECIGVVVYCLYTEVDPPQVSDAFDSFEDKTVILSDVTFTGYIGCRELYLLGEAEMDLGNIVVTGSSADGTPKPALTENDLGNYENLQSALEGAGKKYTITAGTHIDYPLSCEDLEINEGVILTIDAPSEGDGTNGIVVSHSLIVNGNGTLRAEDGQTLEIREGCTTVTGVTLYQDDGITLFENYGDMTETFEYHAGDEKWVRRPTGEPPHDHPNDNAFVVSFDDLTPDNGHSPEVKYQIAGGDEITVTRDETVQFFQKQKGYILLRVFNNRFL
jgi:hypothetical protein